MLSIDLNESHMLQIYFTKTAATILGNANLILALNSNKDSICFVSTICEMILSILK